ncbi:hypothetical protein Hanom_Chr14g01334991 [Helianthus anomalus]
MDHLRKECDVAPTWRIILQGWSITIPYSLRHLTFLKASKNSSSKYHLSNLLTTAGQTHISVCQLFSPTQHPMLGWNFFLN